ncbi:MAG TPA: hypothetical protein VK988_02265 [Acidimicrobiales bacterium]|nr:hypothetical protein [Acidimicrobiales bacterium]
MAFDLKAFFIVVNKGPEKVQASDVFDFLASDPAIAGHCPDSFTQKAVARLSRSHSIRNRAFSRRSSASLARSVVVIPARSPRSMRAWRTQFPERALADTETTGDIDDLVAIIEHHRHGVPLELVGERASGSRPVLLHH